MQKSIRDNQEYVWYRFFTDFQGNLYCTGNSTNTTGNANTVIKLSPQGQLIHAFRYGQNFIWGMSAPDPRGGIINISGRIVYKIDPNGVIEWTQGFTKYQSQVPPIPLDDGYLIFSKYVGGIDRSLVFKIDRQGNLLWSSPSFLNIDMANAVVRQDGRILIAYTTFLPSTFQWAIMELDANGQFQQAHGFPINTGDFLLARDIDLLSDEGILLTGLVDFNFATYNGQALRSLPADLSELSQCTPSLLGVDTEPSNLVEDTINYTLGANRYNGFSVQNTTFQGGSLVLSENLFCSENPPNLQFSLGPDSVLCPRESIILKPDLELGNLVASWSNGSFADSLLVRKTGTYWLELSDPCGKFSFRDSIQIDYFERPNWNLSAEPSTANLGQPIRFSSNLDNISWFYGDSTSTENPLTLPASSILAQGIFAEFRDSTGCLYRDSLFPIINDLSLRMPNAFSPNRDGLNEVFGPVDGTVSEYEMEVFDRFGKRQALLVNEAWDGGDCKAGVYLYKLIYRISSNEEQRILRGFVSLVR